MGPAPASGGGRLRLILVGTGTDGTTAAGVCCGAKIDSLFSFNFFNISLNLWFIFLISINNDQPGVMRDRGGGGLRSKIITVKLI